MVCRWVYNVCNRLCLRARARFEGGVIQSFLPLHQIVHEVCRRVYYVCDRLYVHKDGV